MRKRRTRASLFTRGRRSLAMGGSDPRARRDADGLISDDFVGDGLDLDGEGRIRASLDQKSALAVTPEGDLTIRVAGLIEQIAGSPVALRVREEKVRSTVLPDTKVLVQAAKDASDTRALAAEVRVGVLEEALSVAEATIIVQDTRISTLEGQVAGLLGL